MHLQATSSQDPDTARAQAVRTLSNQEDTAPRRRGETLRSDLDQAVPEYLDLPGNELVAKPEFVARRTANVNLVLGEVPRSLEGEVRRPKDRALCVVITILKHRHAFISGIVGIRQRHDSVILWRIRRFDRYLIRKFLHSRGKGRNEPEA